MLHELLEIKNNRIDLRKDVDYKGKSDSEAVNCSLFGGCIKMFIGIRYISA